MRYIFLTRYIKIIFILTLVFDFLTYGISKKVLIEEFDKFVQNKISGVAFQSILLQQSCWNGKTFGWLMLNTSNSYEQLTCGEM